MIFLGPFALRSAPFSWSRFTLFMAGLAAISMTICAKLASRASADTAAMLFWALLASGQINMRKVDGWPTLATKPLDQPIDLAA